MYFIRQAGDGRRLAGWIRPRVCAGAIGRSLPQMESLEFRRVSSRAGGWADYYKEPAREGWRGC